MENVTHLKIEEGILHVETLPKDAILVIDDEAINRRLRYEKWEGRLIKREEKLRKEVTP